MAVLLGAIKIKEKFLVGFKSNPNKLIEIDAIDKETAKYIFKDMMRVKHGKITSNLILVKKYK